MKCEHRYSSNGFPVITQYQVLLKRGKIKNFIEEYIQMQLDAYILQYPKKEIITLDPEGIDFDNREAEGRFL